MKNVGVKKLDDGKVIVSLSGRIDVISANEIETELIELVDSESAKYMVMNLENVEYMSSSGFRVAIAVLRNLKEKGGSLKLCCVQEEVLRVFDVIELTPLFEIYDNEEEALASF